MLLAVQVGIFIVQHIFSDLVGYPTSQTSFFPPQATTHGACGGTLPGLGTTLHGPGRLGTAGAAATADSSGAGGHPDFRGTIFQWFFPTDWSLQDTSNIKRWFQFQMIFISDLKSYFSNSNLTVTNYQPDLAPGAAAAHGPFVATPSPRVPQAAGGESIWQKPTGFYFIV